MSSLFAKLKLTRGASGRRRSPMLEEERHPAAAVAEPIDSRPAQAPADQQSSLSALQVRLWNGAYDALKQSDPKLVDAFERILTARLKEIQGTPTDDVSDNNISDRAETRCEQMRIVIQDGLDRSEKSAALSEKTAQSLQLFASVKSVIAAGLRSVPQAAVPWACVCIGLEVLPSTINQYQSHRTGLKYVLLRMNWYWNLALLLLNENMVDEASKSFSVEMEKAVVDLYEKLLDYQMKCICIHHRHSLTTLGINVLRLDDWEGRIKSIKEEEVQLNGKAAQYNSEIVKSRLQHILESAQGQEIQLSALQKAIEEGNRNEENRHTSEKDKQCLRELRVTDPRVDKKEIEERKGGLLKDSYLWITQHDNFLQFLANDDKQLLWIDGGAGKGKTMLMCGIIDHLESSNQMLAYFFCQQTDMDLNNATSILRGLIFSLIKQQPGLLPYLRSKHEEHGEKLFHGRTAWVSLKDLFSKMITSSEIFPTIILVDALDECESGRSDFLDFLLLCIKLAGSSVKWIVSSREKWMDIEEKMNTADRKVRLQLHLNQNLVSDAIRFFIRHKVHGLSHLKQYTDEVEKEVERFLQDNANGTFLWVALVCQALSHVPRRRASETLRSFPAGLGALYRRMLQDLERSLEATVCREVLATACVVKRPLTLLELKALLPSLHEFEMDEIEEIIGQCGSFLTTQGMLIQFIHQSAKDFILDDASLEVLPAGVTHQHRLIFRYSVDALARVLRRDIYNLKQPGYSIDHVRPPDTDPLAPIHYACLHWADHLSEAEDICQADMIDGGLLDDLLRRKVLYWFEALSLLKSLGVGVRAMLHLQSIIPSTSRNLTDLIKDANRFILSYGSPIEMAPLQAYASALMFSPQKSRIRQLFSDDQFLDMSLTHSPEVDWSQCIHIIADQGQLKCFSYVHGNNERLIAQSHQTGNVFIRVWDTTTGDCVRSTKISNQAHKFRRASINAEGNVALVEHADALELWDLEKATRLQALEGQGSQLHSAIFPPNSNTVIFIFPEGTIKELETTTGHCTVTNAVEWVDLAHRSQFRHAELVGDGRKVLLHLQLPSGREGEMRLYDKHNGNLIRAVRSPSGGCAIAAASSDCRMFATYRVSYPEFIYIWDADTFDEVVQVESSSTLATFLEGSTMIATATSTGEIKIWGIPSGGLLRVVVLHTAIALISFSGDGTRVATGSFGTVSIWDMQLDSQSRTPDTQKTRIQATAFSEDGSMLASISRSGTIKIWDTKSGDCLRVWCLQEAFDSAFCFSPNGSVLVTLTEDGVVHVWDILHGGCVLEKKVYHRRLATIPRPIFTKDGRSVISVVTDGLIPSVAIWDMVSGETFENIPSHRRNIFDVAASPDGKRLAVCYEGGFVLVWDRPIERSSPLTSFKFTRFGGLNRPLRVFFSGDSRYLAVTTTMSDEITVWDLQTSTCVTRVFGYPNIFTESAMHTVNGQLYLRRDREEGDEKGDEPTCPSYLTVRVDCSWIIRDGFPIIWIPPSYRTHERESISIRDDKIAIGSYLGDVIIFSIQARA
ncbi:hypothetical protein NLG97_g6197 [Lecanicillium saksenae]|uniref:Uncharacterized protein n=1 Tax=Lecanicillium saksenae TaxID=468837 RepID=A0ACC1QTG0_9HYPO|nr:hypothetical protein NLG97_g6197 [Lecanicillium saksenae]